MLIFQVIILMFVVFWGKNKIWTKYILFGNFIFWSMYLQRQIQNPGAIGTILFEFIIILITDFYFLSFSIKQKKEKILKKENSVLQDNIKMYEQQILQINEQNERIYGIRHDLKNQFFHISTLINNREYEKVKDVLNEVLGEVCVQEYVNTGNVSLDSLLNYKIAYAKKQDILVETELVIPIDDIYNTTEIILVAGNLLDNAIEACLKIPKEERFIEIRIKKKDFRTFISIKNSFDGKFAVDKRGNFITTKENEEIHGFGLKNVKKALGNLGDFSYGVESNVFSVTVIIY